MIIFLLDLSEMFTEEFQHLHSLEDLATRLAGHQMFHQPFGSGQVANVESFLTGFTNSSSLQRFVLKSRGHLSPWRQTMHEILKWLNHDSICCRWCDHH
jgi:hypothetical protein